MIAAFLGEYRKTLHGDLSRKVADAPGAANPLFLRTILEELRQFGSFEQLPKQVAHFLEARTPEELFRRVIRRWQKDFDGGRQLVQHTLLPLWAAHKGLAEAEWLEVIRHGQEPVSRPEWRTLFLAMEPHLTQHSGLYAFGHDFLRDAVEKECLPSEDDRRTAHAALADYFEAQSVMSPRKAEEWPWQLHAAEDWNRLEIALTDRELFLALYNDCTKWELTGYWHPLRRRGIDLGRGYALAFQHWLHRDSDFNNQLVLPFELGTYLMENGCYLDAEPLLRRVLESRERLFGPEHPLTLRSLNNLAGLLDKKGDYEQANSLHGKALEIQERVLGPEHPDTLTSMNNIAGLLEIMGSRKQAEDLYRRVLESRERVHGPEHPHTISSMNNLAVLLIDMGNYLQAQPLLRRAMESCERVLGQE